VELRQNHRYRLAAQVSFSCKYANGDVKGGKGLTQDISKSGIFILAPAPPPLEAAVLLDVILPLPETTGTKLRSHGHVVRIEAEGFAVRTDVAFRLQAEKHAPSRTSPKQETTAAESSDAQPVSGPKSKHVLYLQ